VRTATTYPRSTAINSTKARRALAPIRRAGRFLLADSGKTGKTGLGTESVEKAGETVMADTVPRRKNSRLTLNSDGQAHPVLNAFSIFTLLIGLVSFVLGLVIRNVSGAGLGVAIVTTVTGLAALLVGLVTQMVSATREQRVLIVAGIIAGFVGLALGLAHGGFSG
jgi:hypothetical protein